MQCPRAQHALYDRCVLCGAIAEKDVQKVQERFVGAFGLIDHEDQTAVRARLDQLRPRKAPRSQAPLMRDRVASRFPAEGCVEHEGDVDTASEQLREGPGEARLAKTGRAAHADPRGVFVQAFAEGVECVAQSACAEDDLALGLPFEGRLLELEEFQASGHDSSRLPGQGQAYGFEEEIDRPGSSLEVWVRGYSVDLKNPSSGGCSPASGPNGSFSYLKRVSFRGLRLGAHGSVRPGPSSGLERRGHSRHSRAAPGVSLPCPANRRSPAGLYRPQCV